MIDRYEWRPDGMQNVVTREPAAVVGLYVTLRDYDQLQRQYAAAVKASSATAEQLLRLRDLCSEIFGSLPQPGTR